MTHAAKPALPRSAAVIVAALTLLAACSAGQSPSPAPSQGAPSEAPSASAGAVDSAGVTIAYSVHTLGNPIWLDLIAGAKAAAEARGVDIENDFIELSAENDLPTQVEQVEDMIQQGVDLLVLHALDIAGMADVTQRAVEAGMIVVVAGEQMEGVPVATTVVFSEVVNGELAGTLVAEQLGEEGGNVVLLEGIAGTATAQQRAEGFVSAIEAAGNIEIVARQPADYDRGLAQTAMENILTAQDDIDAVYGVNDEMALGALAAARSAGREDEMVFVGNDGIDEMLEEIEAGAALGTVLLSVFKMGSTAVNSGLDALLGEELPERVEMEGVLITIDNVADADEIRTTP